jgi:hypothetical protein
MTNLNELSPENLPEDYGIFPYVIVRISGIYMQIPVVFCEKPFKPSLPAKIGIGVDPVSQDLTLVAFLASEGTLEKLKNMLKDYAFAKTKGKFSYWLVLSEKHSFYYANNELREYFSIPEGGELVDGNMRSLASGCFHYLKEQPAFLTIRRAEL